MSVAGGGSDAVTACTCRHSLAVGYLLGGDTVKLVEALLGRRQHQSWPEWSQLVL